MNYELAKKLKEAGFPFKDIHDDIEREMVFLDNYVPTLEELIEACGDDFVALEQNSSKHVFLMKATPTKYETWTASTRGYGCVGTTPKEAVANLWLALLNK